MPPAMHCHTLSTPSVPTKGVRASLAHGVDYIACLSLPLAPARRWLHCTRDTSSGFGLTVLVPVRATLHALAHARDGSIHPSISTLQVQV